MSAVVDRAAGALTVVKEAMVRRPPSPDRCDLQVVEAWASRTAHLVRVRVNGDATRDVVVKVFKNVAHAAELAPALNELAALLADDPSGRYRPLTTLGFSAPLGAVVMPYVQGPSLEQILGGRPAPEYGRAALGALLAACGRLLAKYHARYADSSRDRAEEAWRDLDGKAATIHAVTPASPHAAPPSIVSRTFGDFHAGHIIVGSHGQLTVLDPGIEWNYSFGARDMACFLDRMLMTLLKPGVTLAAPRRIGWYEELSDAFVRGYDEERSTPPTHGDRLALNIYLAFRLRRRLNSLTRRRPSRLLYYGIPLACQYRRLTRRLAAAQRACGHS
jgi:hypothetical protein